ncbi:MAG: hypothetical protein WBP41_18095, partial [Saprospiraceae bacterium]
MKTVTELRIFLASPRDVEVERTIVQEVITELNITYGTPNHIVLKLVNWEQYSFPAIGEDPQDVINNQLPFDYDVFLCIFWTRIGSRTQRADSGTIEELEIAREKRSNGENIEIMGYFKTEPPSSLKDLSEQYFQVRKLQEDFGKDCLYKEFTSTDKFKEIFRISFTNYLNSKFSNPPKESNTLPIIKPSIEVGNPRRNEIKAKLKSLNLDPSDNSDLLDAVDIITEKSNELVIVLSDITENMNEMTNKITARTEELIAVNRISDVKLKIKKGKVIANNLANELDVISDKYEVYIPDFKDNYLELIHNFITVYSKYEAFMPDKNKEAKNDLILSIDGAIESLTDLLLQMDTVPKITSKYGQAQIRQM